MPASPLVFVQTLPAARSPANCVDAADCNLAAKLRSFVLHHSDWPELIPAESSTENLHWDWYSKRGHFTGIGGCRDVDQTRFSLQRARTGSRSQSSSLFTTSSPSLLYGPR